ncbi:MAG: hypothetical protein FGM24_02450 [Candidatus Kapabacteria bacterium]|nr:hypothetical protein [Candidatus Kapabacteria bacterium]
MSARLHSAVVCLLLAMGCTLEHQRPANAQQPSLQASADTTIRRYGLKSGRLVSAFHRPGQAAPDTTVFIFDDFGRRERSEQSYTLVVGNNQPVRVRTVLIRNGRKVHTLNVERKTAHTSVVGATTREPFVDFMGLSPAELEALHVRRIGVDTVAGLPCDVFAINDPERDIVGTYHVWKNLPIQTDVTINGSRMLITPVEIQSDIDVAPSLFVIPPGYRTYTE